MEGINKSDFIDIYVLKTINEIKKTVTENITLNKERESKIDEKMSLVIKDLINANFKNLQKDPKGNIIYTLLPIVDEKENNKVRLSLVLYYTALYYDNIGLLQDLLREDVKFDYNWRGVRLQYLDKSISSKFETKKYIEMIKNCGYMFTSFVKSIEKLSEEDKVSYIDRFVKLINMKYDSICETLKKKSDYSGGKQLEHLFTKENLDTFVDKTYIQATMEQLDLIDSCRGKKYLKETSNRLNNLMQKKGFSKFLCNFDLMMKLYSDEQLETLDYKISVALNEFSESEECLNKIIDFLLRSPDSAHEVIWITKEMFMKHDNFTLIEICNRVHPIDFNDINFDLLTKMIKPKVVLKRALGVYNKKDTAIQNKLKLVKDRKQ